jgi:phosphoglycerol transferase MdoB-like AlkP superfamily enzyme
MLGPWGREIFGFLYWLLLVAIAGSNMLSVSIAFNSFTSHGTCTVAFVAIAMIVAVGFSLLQTLHKIAWIGWVGLFFLMTASRLSS